MHDRDYRWDDLRVFLAVLRQGSFSAAAQDFGVEQSTVSRRIAALERAVGGRLFDRRTTGPVPTGLAGTLAPLAERVEHQTRLLLETAATAGDTIEGRVRIAVTESFAVQVLVPSVLDGLLAAYPGLEVDLLVGHRSADLAHREADVALRHFRPAAGELTIRRLASLQRTFLASQGYAQGHAGRPPQELDWLVQHVPGTDYQDETFVQSHVGVAPTLRTTGHMTLIAATQAGLGVSILTRGQAMLNDDLACLPLSLPEPAPVDIWLACPSSLRPVPRVAAVWTYLESHLPPLLEPHAEFRQEP